MNVLKRGAVGAVPQCHADAVVVADGALEREVRRQEVCGTRLQPRGSGQSTHAILNDHVAGRGALANERNEGLVDAQIGIRAGGFGVHAGGDEDIGAITRGSSGDGVDGGLNRRERAPRAGWIHEIVAGTGELRVQRALREKRCYYECQAKRRSPITH